MAQSTFTRTVTPDDIFGLCFLQAAQLSPNDRWVCAVVSSYDAERDADIHHLWLYPMENGVEQAPPRQLTREWQSQHHGKNLSPVWSPDSKQIAFVANRGSGGTQQICIIPVDGGEARVLTDLPQGVTGTLDWSPDGKRIAFSTGSEANAEVDRTDPYRVTRHVYRFDAIGNLDQQIHDIYIASVDSGAVQQLTDDRHHNIAPQWSPDSSRLLYLAMLPPDVHGGILPQLHLVDLDGNISAAVGREWGQTSGSATWLPDGQTIAFTGTPAGLPIGSKADLYTVAVPDSTSKSGPNGRSPINHSSGALTGVGGGLQADMASTLLRQPAQLLIADGGQSIYGRVQSGGTLHLYKMALDGSEKRELVLEGDRCMVALGLTSDEKRLVFAASDVNNPWDLFVVDLDNGMESRISALNDKHLSQFPQTEIHHLRFPSTDGVEVEGWLYHPAGSRPKGTGPTETGLTGTGLTGTGQPLPTVLYVHGGPHSAFGHIYHCDTQMLMGAGFAVLMVNHRASTGYGDAFSTAIKGDWGNLDYADLMAGVDAAIEAGLTDGDRLGVCGLSGGGNLSTWIVGQTERFKAAVPENPLTNWSSFYGVSDIGVWFGVEQLGGHLHEIPETYTRCSPITYAHRCTTPTLLVQCESDWRCPAEQSEQFYNVLKANGCPVEMLRLPGGAHGGCVVGPPKLRRAQNQALLDWMTTHVLG